MAQAVRGVIGAGLMVGVAALPALAQSLALPAVEPVGIARSGAQVAYGYSLEAATANPALLASLKEKTGFYLAAGLELASTQQSSGIEPEDPVQFRPQPRHRGLRAGHAPVSHAYPGVEAGRTLPPPREAPGQRPQPLLRRWHRSVRPSPGRAGGLGPQPQYVHRPGPRCRQARLRLQQRHAPRCALDPPSPPRRATGAWSGGAAGRPEREQGGTRATRWASAGPSARAGPWAPRISPA